MNRRNAFNYIAILIFAGGVIQTSLSCSPDPTRLSRNPTELTILAPVVIVGKVLNISVPIHEQPATRYSACFDVVQVIKGDKLQVSQTFCTKYFGTDALCLAQVSPGYSYVVYLNSDLTARYDNHFSAAYLANSILIQESQKGFCNSSDVNDSSCVPPVISDKPNRMIVEKEGSNLNLRCNVVGTRPYVVTWYLKGKDLGIILLNSRLRYDGSLSLIDVSQSYQGRYTCVVQNAAGKTSQNIFFFVDAKSCGGIFMVKKRTQIYSPNFPNQYPSDKSCAWRLCPPAGKRIKFTFNKFFLEQSDHILIDNECTKSLDSSKKYCGSKSPGEFVSHCIKDCVQLRLNSRFKTQFSFFTGMNLTVEPTSEVGTPQDDLLKYYCASDIVIKGRLIKWESWDKVKIYAVESFKGNHKPNATYDVEYGRKNPNGCYHKVGLKKKDQYIFGVMEKGLFKLHAIVPDDAKGGRGSELRKELRKYEGMVAPCS